MPFRGLSLVWLLKSGGGGSGPGGGCGAPPALDVPGSAGKSSDDIVNSDCSDVGCFTIPTATQTHRLIHESRISKNELNNIGTLSLLLSKYVWMVRNGQEYSVL